MQASEYANLNQVERDHWYYAGKREIVESWIRGHLDLGPEHTLFDFGAGTGAFAQRFRGSCRIRVFDSYPESLAILRERFPPECVVGPEGSGIPLPDASVDCVTALDVLEHLADDAKIVHEFYRILRPGGLAVITVPADMKLWSDWDVSLLHFRRYDLSQLKALFIPSEWELVHCAYTNVFAYPAVYLFRKWRKWTNASPGQGGRAEDRLLHPWINWFLKSLYTVPAKTGWFRAPFGVSLLLVARRRC